MKHQMTDTKFTCAKTACSNPVSFGGLFLEACYREEERLYLRIMTIRKLKKIFPPKQKKK